MSEIIKREDIRVGDRIEAFVEENGILHERSGTVAQVSRDGLYTKEGGLIWNGGWYGSWQFRLLVRPKPPLPTTTGTIILAEMPLETVPLILRRDGVWDYLNGESFYATSFVQQHPWKLMKLVDA